MPKQDHPTVRIEPNRVVARDFILDFYYLLRDGFIREFGPRADPLFALTSQDFISVRDSIEVYKKNRRSVGILLPSHNGWYYSPEDLSPRPVAYRWQTSLLGLPGSYRTSTLGRFISSLDLPRQFKFRQELAAIESGIEKRAAVHSLSHRAEDILRHAIECAKEDVKDPEAIQLESASQSERIGRLLRMRLDWLRLWYINDKRYRAKSRQRVSSDGRSHIVTEARVDGYKRLVKREEYLAVYDLLMDYRHELEGCGEETRRSVDIRAAADLEEEFCLYGQTGQSARLSIHPLNEDRINENMEMEFCMLGEWYAVMLWRCGAGPRERRQIRGTRQGVAAGRCCTWTETAARIYDEQIDLQERQEARAKKKASGQKTA